MRLGRAAPAILSKHVVQPIAERLEIHAEPADPDSGLVEFVGRLFAGREQEGQSLEESAVGRCQCRPFCASRRSLLDCRLTLALEPVGYSRPALGRYGSSLTGLFPFKRRRALDDPPRQTGQTATMRLLPFRGSATRLGRGWSRGWGGW